MVSDWDGEYRARYKDDCHAMLHAAICIDWALVTNQVGLSGASRVKISAECSFGPVTAASLLFLQHYCTYSNPKHYKFDNSLLFNSIEWDFIMNELNFVEKEVRKNNILL